MKRGYGYDKDTMTLLRSWFFGPEGEQIEDADVHCCDVATPAFEAGPRVAVRVSPLFKAEIDAEIDIATSRRPWAIILPRCRDGVDVQQLGGMLAVREARLGLGSGEIGIVAFIDSAAGLMNLASFRGASPRLIALVADAESLRHELGGRRAPSVLATARANIVLAAAAAGILAIDGAASGPFDADASRAEAQAAFDDGFAGKVARRTDEVALYNEVFGA